MTIPPRLRPYLPGPNPPQILTLLQELVSCSRFTQLRALPPLKQRVPQERLVFLSKSEHHWMYVWGPVMLLTHHSSNAMFKSPPTKSALHHLLALSLARPTASQSPAISLCSFAQWASSICLYPALAGFCLQKHSTDPSNAMACQSFSSQQQMASNRLLSPAPKARPQISPCHRPLTPEPQSQAPDTLASLWLSDLTLLSVSESQSCESSRQAPLPPSAGRDTGVCYFSCPDKYFTLSPTSLHLKQYTCAAASFPNSLSNMWCLVSSQWDTLSLGSLGHLHVPTALCNDACHTDPSALWFPITP